MKYALCSEVFKTPIDETIRSIAEIGFDGIEIAPFNVAESVDDVSAARRSEIRKVAEDCGIEIVGLHWLLLSPKGLHITTPDDAVRRRSFEYMRSLVHFCADLGGTVMIHGSPQQRNLVEGDTLKEATKRAADGISELGGLLDQRNVKLLLEPLNSEQTNFMDTVESAVALAERVDHPKVGYMLDTRAISHMPDGVIETIRKFGQGAGHYHTNQPDGRGPGMGDFDFRPVFDALRDAQYQGWISCEPFDYEPDSETVGRTALETLKAAAGES